MTELGKWIKGRFGSQQSLADELGIQQARISKWLNLAEPVPATYQEKLRGLKYKGLWPREEKAQEAEEAAAGASVGYATIEEVAELRGSLKAHVEYWEKGEEKVLRRLEDAIRRIEALERRVGGG